MQGDRPSGDIDSILHCSEEDPLVVLVPSRNRLGTNALLLSPTDAIPLRFGYDSFSYHRDQAEGRGLPLRILESERIGLDIDEPEDLESLLAVGKEAETYGKILRTHAQL